MKKMWVLCFLLVGLMILPAWAADDKVATSLQGDKGLEAKSNLPRVMIMYINNAKTEYNAELDAKIMDHLKKVGANRWSLLPGDAYKDKLSAMGIQSFSLAERSDILAITKDSEADALLLIEVEPFNVRDVITFFTVGKKITATMPVKVIDRNTGLYLYNGKFVEMAQDNSMIGGIGNKSVIIKALDKVFGKFDLIIPEKLATVKRMEK